MKEYDLIIVGSGTPFRLLSRIKRDKPAMKVAMIDKDPIGGICINRGCVPSKMLISPASMIQQIKESKKLGITCTIDDIDFGRIQSRMNDYIRLVLEKKKQFFQNNANYDYFTGVATFIDKYKLKVDKFKLKAPKILLSLGSEPFVPPIDGIENVPFYTNKNIFSIKKLPKSIVFLGGGYIAVELGHFFGSLGSEVTIIERQSRILGREEPEVSALVQSKLSDYVQVLCNHEIKKVGLRIPKSMSTEMDSELLQIDVFSRKDDEKRILYTDALFISAGRTSNASLLKPEVSHIKTTDHNWIKTNEYLETTCPGIWAVGDSNGKFQLKHIAIYENDIVYENIIHGAKNRVDYSIIPYTIFTHPEVGGVGLSEREAINKHSAEQIEIGFSYYANNVKARSMGYDDADYFVKLVLLKNRNRLLGASIIGPDASVLIQIIVTAIYSDESSADLLERSIFVHPTLSKVIESALKNRFSIEEYHRIIDKKKKLRKD